MKKVQGKKVLENKNEGSSNRKPKLSTRAQGIIIYYNPWDIANLTVNELARKLNVTFPHLSSTFRKEMGFTLSETVLRQKMLVRAVFLDQKPEFSVKKVSEIIGFYSVDYFYKLFKLN